MSASFCKYYDLLFLESELTLSVAVAIKQCNIFIWPTDIIYPLNQQITDCRINRVTTQLSVAPHQPHAIQSSAGAINKLHIE